MPIRRFPLPDHPGSQIVWDASTDPPTLPLSTVIPRDVPDPMTPLHDALFAVFGMGGRHALNPSREVPAVGRHTDSDGNQIADHAERTFTKDDGTTYQRISADDIEDCDHVDSTTIVDDGAPD